MEQIPHMKNYFGDIDDELTTTLVSVEIYVNVCEELKSEYEHYSDAFTNLILLVLTLVTGVFIPINVYAAIFGMNFTALDWITDFEANPSGFQISFTLVFILSLSLAIGAVRIISVVAPLAGLLGTVTGMIVTFQMITLYGTGDPKLMAGGISQALVTTVLGLLVAIPTTLLHSFTASFYCIPLLQSSIALFYFMIFLHSWLHSLLHL